MRSNLWVCSRPRGQPHHTGMTSQWTGGWCRWSLQRTSILQHKTFCKQSERIQESSEKMGECEGTTEWVGPRTPGELGVSVQWAAVPCPHCPQGPLEFM